jgi:hypothetical protein
MGMATRSQETVGQSLTIRLLPVALLFMLVACQPSVKIAPEARETSPASVSQLDTRAWKKRSPQMNPGSRTELVMCYAGRGTVIAFGGFHIDDTATWEWNSATGQWTPYTTSPAPPSRDAFAMAYDSGRDRVVLFGGRIASSKQSNDMWEWNGVNRTWKQIVVDPSPPAAGGIAPAMGYDPVRKRTVLVGASDNLVWEWDGTNWTHVEPTVMANTSWGKGMAYLPALGKLVYVNSSDTAEFWLWDGKNWSDAGVGPTVQNFGVAYAGSGRLLLFGGQEVMGSLTPPLDRMWEWDGKSTEVSTATRPIPRIYLGMAYDEKNDLVVMNGGTSYYGPTDTRNQYPEDTWEYRISIVEQGSACDPAVNGRCTTGHCVDGVCCAVAACTGTCRACNVPGHEGTCADVPAGTSHRGTCAAPMVCGMGASCGKGMGMACAADPECSGGHCADGFCCESACDSPCHTCGSKGHEGTCATLDQTVDSPSCVAPRICALGVCSEVGAPPLPVDAGASRPNPMIDAARPPSDGGRAAPDGGTSSDPDPAPPGKSDAPVAEGRDAGVVNAPGPAVKVDRGLYAGSACSAHPGSVSSTSAAASLGILAWFVVGSRKRKGARRCPGRPAAASRTMGLAFLLTTAGLARVPDAHAADPEALIREANRLRNTGNDVEAYKLLIEAYTSLPSARTAGQLGLCEYALGMWIESERHLLEALRPQRDAWVEKNRKTLSDVVAAAQSHLSRIEILGSPPGTVVEIQGKSVGTLPLAGPVRVVAGEVHIRLSAPGYKVRRKDITVVADEPSVYATELEPEGAGNGNDRGPIAARASAGVSAEGASTSDPAPAVAPVWGAFVRVDLAVYPAVGQRILPGLSYRLSDPFELSVAALLGRESRGAWAGGRFALLSGRVRPTLELGIPFIFYDGGSRLGVQPGVGCTAGFGQHLEGFASLSTAFFPGAGGDLGSTWILPAIGLQARF